MPQLTPTRTTQGRVAMQVARTGGPPPAETDPEEPAVEQESDAEAERAAAVSSRGRHRSPDARETADTGPAEAAAPAPEPRESGDDGTGARRSRHAAITGAVPAFVASSLPAGALARVDAAREAAERPAGSSAAPAGPPAPLAPPAPTASPVPERPATRPTAPAAAATSAARPAAVPSSGDGTRPAGPSAAASPGPARRSSPEVLAERSARAERRRSQAPEPAPDDDAVTDLVSRADLRGRLTPDGPGGGRVPGVLGLLVGLVALLGAAVAAAEPLLLIPGLGRLGESPLALAAVVGLALAGLTCSVLGVGAARQGRGLAVVGIGLGVAALAASLVPILALGSL